jgi:hypothetical protein
MIDPHDTRPHPQDEVAIAPLAIPGYGRPTVTRTVATSDGNLSAQLARMILDTHTSLGDVVLDIDNDSVFAAVAARSRRRHHALDGAQHMATMGHVAGYIDMILLHWPRSTINPRLLLIACRSLLATSGALVIVACAEPGARIRHLSALVGATATADLVLLEHVVAIDAAADTATRVAAPGNVRRPQRIWFDGSGTVQPLVPHTDVLVFGRGEGTR